jgi:hypothetical protein
MAFSTPFFGGAPLARPVSYVFFGWPSQVQLELTALLKGREASWLNAVAQQIQAMLDAEPGAEGNWQSVLVQDNPSRSAGTPFPYQVCHLSKLGLFAAREPVYDWSQHSTTTEQWERYAVFAVLTNREAFGILDNLFRYPSDDLAYYDAGGYAIEAMRALQLAQSLRAAKLEKSRQGQVAARARHGAMEPFRTKAIVMANSQPFKTKRAAIDHIVENLELDPVRRTFPSRRAVEEWLKAANWKPPLKKTAT